MSNTDTKPARTDPMTDIFDYFLALQYERNPNMDEYEALYAAERHTERYAR